MSLYALKVAGVAGKGLFATSDVAAETTIIQEDRPLVAALDSTRLKVACSWCFIYTEESSEEVTLSVCTGCRILRFCGTECQTAAWKHSHKLECKLYKKLYPAILPNTARMLVQILLRRKKGTFSQEEWTTLYGLSHHIEGFKTRGGFGNETYENIQLMSRAAQEYGETGDDLGLVETLGGRTIVNSMSLVSPMFTPIGIALSLKTAFLNHSCEPNCAITFNGPNVTVRSLKSIKSGDELKISYIDNTCPTVARLHELSSRYFFDCECPSCRATLTLGYLDTPNESEMDTPETEALEHKAMSYIAKASEAKGPVSKDLVPLARALVLYDKWPYFPAWRQPLSLVRSDVVLQLLAKRHYLPALLQSLKQRFYVNPVAFPEIAHPARVSRTFVLSKLTMAMETLSMGTADDDGNSELGDGGQDVRDLQIKFGIDWQLLTWALVAEVGDLVERSHGKGTRFDKEVKLAVEDMKTGFRSRGLDIPGAAEARMSFYQMKRLADEGWEFWKDWERDARKKKPKPSTVVTTTGEPAADPIAILIGEQE